MNQSFLDAVLRFVELSSATVKRALDENAHYRQSQARASYLQEPLLEHLINTGIVASTQKQAAEAMLNSHAESLQLLKAAADKIVELRQQMGIKQANDLGRGDDSRVYFTAPGRGQYDSLQDPFIGRKTTEKKASDMALLKLVSGNS